MPARCRGTRCAPIKRSPLVRKTPLPRSARPRSRTATERAERRTTRLEHGMVYADARAIVYVRAAGRCEVCGRPLGALFEAHHRLTRKLGPDCPCNLLCLCSGCHHGPEVHGGPEAARAAGRILSRHSSIPPTDEPVTVWAHGTVRLDCTGGLHPVAP